MNEHPTAIVTAAGRGIGEGLARHLAGIGYRLVLMSNSGGAKKLATELGCIGLQGSVTNPADIDRAVQTAVDAFERVDLAVNNTGHPATGDLLAIDDADWHTGLDLLLLNVVRMARAVTPIMERQGGGAIVNISTYAAVQPNPRFPISSTLRAALAAWTKLYADAHGDKNIRINNILPGSFDNYTVSPEHLETIPLRRQGRMDELGRVVAFLASPDAAYITGQSIRVDGGLARAL
ncbi:MAG: SDR family oxidoreductase [Chloroflexi bacterium]|nr:SDR family oxidoreductase [Chloroflexota bacterium]